MQHELVAKKKLFIDEGCFLVQLSKYGKGKLDAVSLSFKVSQHLRDELLPP